MVVWALCIVALILAGFATAFIGLVLTGPWLGLATWHAYRDLVPLQDGKAQASPDATREA
jgi:uncharacterized membrane protein